MSNWTSAFDWTCKKCEGQWFADEIKDIYHHFCPYCGEWHFEIKRIKIENQTYKHDLKIYPQFFDEIIKGDKKFEVRKNDRDYKLNDVIVLREYNPENELFTGRFLIKKICHILYGGQFGIEDGYCVFSIK